MPGPSCRDWLPSGFLELPTQFVPLKSLEGNGRTFLLDLDSCTWLACIIRFTAGFLPLNFPGSLIIAELPDSEGMELAGLVFLTGIQA